MDFEDSEEDLNSGNVDEQQQMPASQAGRPLLLQSNNWNKSDHVTKTTKRNL
jgi:hypothetical protein